MSSDLLNFHGATAAGVGVDVMKTALRAASLALPIAKHDGSTDDEIIIDVSAVFLHAV